MPATKEATSAEPGVPVDANVSVIDIRGNDTQLDLKAEIAKCLNPKEGPRSLPTLLLYNKKGLQIYEDVTYLEEYYLIKNEIDVLEKRATEMASMIPDNAMVVELGSGNLRKVRLLLDSLESAGKTIDYYALDLSRDELERTLAELPEYRHVSSHGLWGTYDDGREWLKAVGDRPKCILHLGSSIGNFPQDEAAAFLRAFADMMAPQDAIMIGVDSCMQPEKVYRAYNDSKGITHEFIRNGLIHANEIYGKEIFHLPDWKVIGEYVYDEYGGRHQAFVAPIRDVEVLGHSIRAFERVQIEQSLKYSQTGANQLWRSAGLESINEWTITKDYGIHQLRRSNMSFPLQPSQYAPFPLPTMENWKSLWAVWDTVTRQMLPDQELSEKPIKLRNACIFYLGHIPTFLDIQLTKTSGGEPTSPASYWDIFERGVDPDVDDPEKCHDHSEIPNEWPPVEDILAYQGRVRSKLADLYVNGQSRIPRHIGRAVWLGFEHEIMHLETLLYMMLQSPKVLPPPHIDQPDFKKMAQEALKARVPNQWINVPSQKITIGLDDPEDGAEADLHFGWDNEKPSRREVVSAFQAKARPITNEEYAEYLYSTQAHQIPASWVSADTNGCATHLPDSSSSSLPSSFMDGKAVRTVWGPVPLRLALDWPVFASYDELVGCATWMGGRIPTFEEARSIYSYVEKQRKKTLLQSKLAAKLSAVNGHLVNDGVEESPPSHPESTVDNGDSLFVDLADANVGFRHWHPTPVTHRGDSLSGQGEMGGVWEWTSSQLRRHEGFEPMPLYPGYTADFFDDKHNVVLGGSWATHPRIAGRKSFVNWYQRKYPYAWVGARLVRDVGQ